MATPTVVFYVSGHGFGHASRDIEVANALRVRCPDVRIHFRTRAARWLFDLTVRGPFTFAEVEADLGVVQIDALTPDPVATLARASAFYSNDKGFVREEADALAEAGATLVVADLPPLAFAAAARAGVPAVAFGNFTWDWIYEDYVHVVGQGRALPRRIRALHATAAEAWRLPMAGGFDGFTRVRDLPLVARRSRFSRPEARERLGWPLDRRIALVSFGGVGLGGLPVERVAAGGDYLVVTTEDPGRDRGALPPLSRTVTDRLVRLDERRLYDEGLRYEDVVAASDVVVTKPGYGIVAECIANQTALVYTSRGRFAEYDVLVAEMPRWLRSRYMPRDDLLAARWHKHLNAVLEQKPPFESLRVDGAAVAAEWIQALLVSGP